jgi:CPA1 family monovalent cation:H+ antiporter
VVELTLTRDLILLVFLPPLLFEGALNMDLDDLRRRWREVSLLAILGTVVAVAIVAMGFRLLELGWPESILFGVMLAPTDPVAVLAILKEHGVGEGLRTLLEGESIFNDAISIVLYLITVEFVEGSGVGFQQGLFEFGLEVAVGLASGIAVGLLAHHLMRAVDDHLVETTLAIATAFGGYLLADNFHGSGVIAVVAAGLLIGNWGRSLAMSPTSQIALSEFWAVVAFLANSLVFLLVGASIDIGRFAERDVLAAVAIGVVTLFVGRAVIVYGLLRGRRRDPIPTTWRHAVFWGGLRGAIPIALVLGLNDRNVGGLDAPAVVFGVVLVSLLGQGLTYRPLLSRLGLVGSSQEIEDYERHHGRTLALRAARRELEELERRGLVVAPVYDQFVEQLDAALDRAEQNRRAMASDSDVAQGRQVRRVARRLAAVQRSELAQAGRAGVLSSQVVRELRDEIDAQLEAHEEADEAESSIIVDPGDTR